MAMRIERDVGRHPRTGRDIRGFGSWRPIPHAGQHHVSARPGRRTSREPLNASAVSLLRLLRQRDQPRTPPLPFSLDGATRYAQRIRGLVEGIGGKETAFDDAHHFRIELLEAFEQLVDQRHLLGACRPVVGQVRQVDVDANVPALGGENAPRVVDQYLAHGLGGDGEIVAPVLPFQRGRVGELGVPLMHQRSRVQGLAGTPSGQLIPGDLLEVLVDQRHDRRGRRFAPLVRGPQEARDLAGITIVHCMLPVSESSTIDSSIYAARRRVQMRPGTSRE